MQLPLIEVHVAAGGLGLIAGFVALYATKGARLHRRVGMGFVIAMITMAVSALLIMAFGGAAPAVNVLAASLTIYLVVTALATVRPPSRGLRWLNLGAMLVALAVGVTSLTMGFEAVASADGQRDGIPAFPYFMFGVVGVLGGALDLRVIGAGGVRGPSRLGRHLWRMCFALFIAAMSFFLGQAKVIPEPIRIPPLLALPPLAVLVTMFYWLWRVRAKRAAPRIAALRATLQ